MKRKLTWTQWSMFLVQKFNQGEAGGQKADPVQVPREMKSIRDSGGKLQFKPDEWRTAQLVPFSQGRQRCSAKDKLMK